MKKVKKSSTLVSHIPVTWAAILFDGKPFSTIPESEVADFKKWYPRGNWIPTTRSDKPFYRTGIPFVTHNKRQMVVEVIFGKSEEIMLPETTAEEIKKIISASPVMNHLVMFGDIATDATKFHMEVNK